MIREERLYRPCKRCGVNFRPLGKYNWVCKSCIKKPGFVSKIKLMGFKTLGENK